MKTLKYLPILLFLTCTAWAGEKVSDEIAYKIIEKVNQDAIANMKKEFKPINKINNFKMVIDTTWGFIDHWLDNGDLDSSCIFTTKTYIPSPRCFVVRVDTTWVEDTTDEITILPRFMVGSSRLFLRGVEDTTLPEISYIIMGGFKANVKTGEIIDTTKLGYGSLVDTSRILPERLEFKNPVPLKFKVDTVRVDTVGFVKDSTGEHPGFMYRLDCIGHWVQNGGVAYDSCSNMSHYEFETFWRPKLSYTIDTTYYLTPEQIRKLEGR